MSISTCPACGKYESDCRCYLTTKFRDDRISLPTRTLEHAPREELRDCDRGLICRMAGNIAGDMMNLHAMCVSAVVDDDARSAYIEKALERAPAAALDMAEAIVAEYDRRHS